MNHQNLSFSQILILVLKLLMTSKDICLVLINRQMSQFNSSILWKFDKFEPSTVWAAQKLQRGEAITASQLTDKKIELKKLTLASFTSKSDPFSLIDAAHNLLILDKKKVSKDDSGRFVFNESVGYQTSTVQYPPESQNYMSDIINRLHDAYVANWNTCLEVISSLQKEDHPLAKQLSKYLSSKSGKAEIIMVGNNPVGLASSHKLHIFFAIKHQNGSAKLAEQLKDDLQGFLSRPHAISKYVVFNQERLFFELQFGIQFAFKAKNIQSLSGKNKLKAKVTVQDSQKLFEYCAADSLRTSPRLLDDFEFDAHGDYIEYPFRESLARKRKYMKMQSYSLVFQGGGAKGVAYVGAYQAIKEMTKNGNAVPITSIMGSSAGGIIALAVSTNIEPFEVQKICYKMGAIPRTDRIDRSYLRSLQKYGTDEKIDEQKEKMLKRVVELLNEYGIIQKNAVEELTNFFKGLDKKKLDVFVQRLIDYLLASTESIGQIFDFRENNAQEFNYLGLLLEGALMRGQAIHDIGSQCLVKFVLSKGEEFLEQKYKQVFGQELSKELRQSVDFFNLYCKDILEISLKQFAGEKGNRVLFAIINKILMIIDRNLTKASAGKDKFILSEPFAASLLECFDFTSIYDDDERPYPQGVQAIPERCPNLYRIIYNHHKLHPASTFMGVTDLTQKEEKLKAVNTFLTSYGQIPYETITQLIAEEYFFDPKNFTLKQEMHSATIGEFLSKFFLEQNQYIFKKDHFYREVAEIIVETLNAEELSKEIVQLNDYNHHFNAFKKSVQKITLGQYYKITKIELTCTSVDLDNKVLRFFNQKTTPNLPVCRAVQMTGSFPVGFKAQTWKENWGRYLIHYENCRREVILEGHQFTDGGMLANFPIKYFDNDHIRDVYFSHVTNRSRKNEKPKNPYETIMLGFGLDKLTCQQYTPNESEVYRKLVKETNSGKAMILLKESFFNLVGFNGIISGGIASIKLRNVINAFRYPERSEVLWKLINKNLISDIPLLSFGFKLLEAYPKADRNLNLECFKDSVYRTTLLPAEKPIQHQASEKTVSLQEIVSNDQYKNMDIFEKEKSLWEKGKNAVGGLFTRKKEVKQDPSALSDIISSAIKSAPLKKFLLEHITETFSYGTKGLIKIESALTDEQVVILKRKIKHQIFRIISNRMKQKDFGETKIEQHTLQFLRLRYSKKISNSLNDLAAKKFEECLNKKKYEEIEKQLPFEDFKKKIYETEIMVNKQFDPSRYDQQELARLYNEQLEREKKKLIEEKRQYIYSQLNDQDKKEYLNIQQFYLANNDKYLIQYIFLSKLNEQDLELANKEIQKTSVKSLLRHLEKEEDGKYYAYLTIRDLKAFYRRIFSGDTSKEVNKRYSPVTFLEQEDVRAYEFEDQIEDHKLNPILTLPENFNESIYLDRKVSVNSIFSEALLLKRAQIEKIEFIRIIGEAFSNIKIRSQVQQELFKMIDLNRDKYNALLAAILYPNQSKLFRDDYFRELLAKEDQRRLIIEVLFDKDGLYFSQNQHIQGIYRREFDAFKAQKSRILEEINQQIGQESRDKKSQYSSLMLQNHYFQHLEEKINYQLLIEKIGKATNIDYHLQNADLSTGMGTASDRLQREAIRSEINSEQVKRAKECEEMIKTVKLYQNNFHTLDLYLNQIRVGLYQFCFKQKQQNANFKIVTQIRQTADIIGKNFICIKEWLVEELTRVVSLPIGSIQPKHIEEIYTLDYVGIKNIFQALFSIMRRIEEVTDFLKRNSVGKKLEQALIEDERQLTQLDNMQILQDYIGYTFSYFDYVDFKLPHFEIVWGIYMKEFKSQEYSKTLLQGLNKQFANTFINKCISTHASQLKVHLILEGSDLSNYYYAYYYELFDYFKQQLISSHQQSETMIPYQIERSAKLLNVRAITTSSFHSIFGFLVALNYSSCHLKNQMVAIREIAQTFQPQRLVEGYFDSYQWASLSSNQYKQFWSYIKQEKYNLFNELEKLANKSLPNYNLTDEFKQIRSIYQHEEENVLKYCDDILDDISDQIGSIDKNVDPRFKALEISRKYAYNYTCSYRKQHEYAQVGETSHQLYQKIIKKIFNSYGSLLEGIITNTYTSQIKMKLPRAQSGAICRGFVVRRLLTTFKIKEFVIAKLKENTFRENITLSEFFKHAPVKVLLNFTTINVNSARLEFMNKNTLPNMPVWAAIVSASCLPYFYKDFECPREWEHAASDTASLYEIIVDDFFKSTTDNNERAKFISGNIISSLPLELLTNETTLQKMFTFETDGEPYLHIGFAFDSNEEDYKNSTHILQRNYLQVGLVEAFKIWKNSSPQVKFNANCTKGNDKHKNTNYTLSATSDLISKLGLVKGSSLFSKYLGILTECNDNFILYAYWNRLIRLPIKIDTLDFHEITNIFLKTNYGADVASDKTKDTVERSYEITKYFEREQFGTKQDRYEFNIRVVIIDNEAQVYGEEAYFAKIELLSHSKWNRNRYNNFLVSYSSNPLQFNSTAKVARESEILWNLNQSSKVYLRFYFPNYVNDNINPYSSITFSQLQVSLLDIVKELPLKNSYDYAINFCQPLPEGELRDPYTGLMISENRTIAPFRKNKIAVTEHFINPPLIIRSWAAEGSQGQQSYIRPLQ